jgi:hypothetical protein
MKNWAFLLLIFPALIFADAVPTQYDTLIFAENFETDLEGWITKDFSDSKPMWHIDTYKALGDTGHAWWCGTADTMLLASAPGYGKMWQQYLLHSFDLSSAVAPVILSFYHLYDTETYLGPDGYIGSDGGTVQVSVDGGQTWQLIEPIGSYPYENITSFLNVHDRERLNGFSGKLTEWEKVQFNLDAFLGKQILIRWYFASDYAADDYDMPIDSLYFKFMDQFNFSPIVKFDSDGAWYLDNIKIRDANEILFFDDVEGGINEWSAEYEHFTPKVWQLDHGNIDGIDGEFCLRCTNEAPINPDVKANSLSSMNALEGIFTPELDFEGMNKIFVTFWARNSINRAFGDHNFYVDKYAQMIPANFFQVAFDFGREYDENFLSGPEDWYFRSYNISHFARNKLVRLLFNYCWINQEGMTGLAIDDLKIYASPRFQHDLAIADIELSDSLQVGTLSMFNIKLINAGTDTIQRKLISWSLTIGKVSGEIVYEYSGKKPIPSNFPPDSITYFTVSESKAWQPTEPGEYDISVVVNYPGEINTKNDTLSMNVIVSPATGVNDNTFTLPIKFKLDQNYPNPFNPETQISYDVPKQSHIKIDIYNAIGQHVKTMVNSKQAPGQYNIMWDGTDENSEKIVSGLYFCRLQGDGFHKTIKLVLTK